MYRHLVLFLISYVSITFTLYKYIHLSEGVLILKYKFPKDFWWGSAVSGPQTEGVYENDGKGDSIWDHWYKENPELFFDQVGPDKASLFYTEYKDDIQLMKKVGHNSFRTSIQWSRLIPNGTGEVNPKAVEFYNNVIDELIAVFLVQILWFFGLHGQVIVNSVMDPIWLSTAQDNYAAFTDGASELPHIVTKPFMETYTVGMGGSGSTLIVVVLMAFFMKSRQMKDVGRLALGPGIFNVNEPAIFGLPIVLNAAIFIPWVLAPMVTTAFNYIMISTGIFPMTIGAIIPWTIPFFINGALATNSIMGGVLQLISMGIIGLIWYPFLKLVDKQNLLAANDLSQPE